MAHSQSQAQYLQGDLQFIRPHNSNIHSLQSASGTPLMDLLSTSLLVRRINFQCTPSVPPLPIGQHMRQHLSNYAYTRYVDRGQ